MNHVNCPQGITIFAQLLDNFLLLWHFTVFLLSFFAACANTPLTDTLRAFFYFFFAFFVLHNIQDAITPLGDAKINLKSSQTQSVNV